MHDCYVTAHRKTRRNLPPYQRDHMQSTTSLQTPTTDNFTVLVVGNTYLDEFIEIPCFPSPDGKFSATAITDDLGGSATNACCAFMAYGTRASLHSVIGSDEVAERLWKMLEDRMVDVRHCYRAKGKTGRTIVLLTPDGVSTKIGHSGIANQIDNYLLPVQELVQFSHIHLASVSLELLEHVLDIRKEYTRSHPEAHFPTISLDLGAKILSADPKKLQRLFVEVGQVSLNEFALQQVYNVDVDSPDLDPDWISKLQQNMREALHSKDTSQVAEGAEDPIFLITLGKNGAYAVTCSEHYFKPSLPTKVVDSTGAGDAFAAAFATFRYRLGNAAEEALQKAHIAASTKIKYKGGTNGHPSTSEIEQHYRKMLDKNEK
jgi:ribokinase